jgi:hypothetical protein
MPPDLQLMLWSRMSPREQAVWAASYVRESGEAQARAQRAEESVHQLRQLDLDRPAPSPPGPGPGSGPNPGEPLQ